jgi:hypothetical protein
MLSAQQAASEPALYLQFVLLDDGAHCTIDDHDALGTGRISVSDPSHELVTLLGWRYAGASIYRRTSTQVRG